MDKILFINGCVRPESRTLDLAKTVLAQLNGDVQEVDPAKLHGLDNDTLTLRTELAEKKQFDHPMFKAAKEFAEADVILVAAPYWDLLFPASIRTYFENVTVSGVTFYYSPEGIPQSLCRGKKLIYVATSGGSLFGTNLGYEYVKAISQGFFGITDTIYLDAQGLDIWGADVEGIMNAAKENAVKLLHNK